jgi:hypothetical protein
MIGCVCAGGDWTLSRTAALFFEGTEGLTVEDCEFERNDGNALMLSGYNRHATVRRNNVRWNGGTAITLWGKTDMRSDQGRRGWDATSGDFPRWCSVDANFVHEVGVFEKQSSCTFSALAAQNNYSRNTCFNIPRAGME